MASYRKGKKCNWDYPVNTIRTHVIYPKSILHLVQRDEYIYENAKFS